MSRSALATACALIVALLCSCTSDSRPPTVPRPEAFPRIADPGTDYITVDSLPVILTANATAELTHPSPLWIDINYPSLKAVVHISLTPASPDQLPDIIANRTQRMALNLPDRADAEEITLNSEGGFSSVLLSSPDARSTPLQFLAHDGHSWVVSGVAFFPGVAPDAPVDSLAPAVDFIRRDLIRSLTSLAVK